MLCARQLPIARLKWRTAKICLTHQVRKSTMQHFSLKKLTLSEDLPAVLKLVKDVSVADSPLPQMASLNLTEMKHFYSLRAEATLAHKASFGLYEESSGNLVAMLLNSIYRNDNSTLRSAQYEYDLSEFNYSKEMLAFVRFMQWFARDIFEELNTDSYMDFGMSAVDPMYRRHGLAYTLHMQSENFARKQGVSYAVLFPTKEEIYTALKKHGFSLLRKVRYRDYVDSETGKPLFTTQVPPDAHVYLVVKKL